MAFVYVGSFTDEGVLIKRSNKGPKLLILEEKIGRIEWCYDLFVEVIDCQNKVSESSYRIYDSLFKREKRERNRTFKHGRFR